MSVQPRPFAEGIARSTGHRRLLTMYDRSPAAPRLVCGSGALVFATRVWACHHRVWGDDFADYATWYSDLFEKHAKREGHRLALAQEGDIVTGYGWGYIGQRGQPWSDRLCAALPERISSQWVGGHFDVVELVVLPEHRRRGLGQALHDCLLDGVTGRCLLSTSSDPDDSGVRLYARSGWKTLGALGPGVQVMGLERA
jgi:ribosomal protein S18 acetylase RimI-like enzyme